ncbi:transglycosylase domain-containing protein [Nocardia sp. CA-119907]|uniref:transglycosylase domain-containing protein n=1 Tax=Nocardia sp. CA-119907 TaxID=3239973 RepID=UPI003D996EFA
MTAGAPPSGPPPRRNGADGGSGGPGGRRPGEKKKSPWRIVRRVIYVLLALSIVLPSVVFLIAYSTVSVPQPGDLKTNQVATILASDGTSVISKVVPPEGNRTDVTIDQIPPHVRNAVIAAEDRDFYTNPGFSVSGFVRAARDQALNKESAGGGSTITQQYVKNALVGDEHSLTRKLHELVISAKMARQWSKDEILAAYLNTIYFGRGAYGIDAAAKAYFGKPVQDLTIAEGAVLAATIQQPSGLDPEKNPEGAKTRWNYVLDGMVSGGNLKAEERQAQQFPQVVPVATTKDKGLDAGPEGLIKTQVLKELSAAGISEQQLNTAGLSITTTIDPKAQQAAVDAAQKKMQGEPDKLRAAVVSVDPKTGAVRAYYGGDDGQGYDFANAGLQPGSSFKVFGLAENLELGKPLSEMYDSSPITVNGIKITNVEGEQCGTCTIAEALKRSLNTSFYRMELDMQNGPAKIADMAHKLGIPETIPGVGKSLVEPDGSPPNNGIVLGQYQARVLDMASAYATLAASGIYHAPHFVTKVVTADGQVLLDRGDVAGERRVSEAVADNVTAAMKPIAAWSRNHNLANGRESATKTGTAQLGDTGENKDAWMVGYTPSLSTAVWVGSIDNSALRNYSGGMVYGSGLPSDIWKATMDGALQGTPNQTFPKPAPIKGQAGVPEWSAPFTPPSTTEAPLLPPIQIVPNTIDTPFGPIQIPGVQPQTQQRQPQQQQQPESTPLPGQPTVNSDGSLSTTTGSPPPGGAGNGNGNGNGNQPTRTR